MTALRTLLTAATLIASLAAAASTARAQATDHCINATNLTAAGNYPFDMAGATHDANTPAGCDFPEPADDVWYKFTAPTDGLLSAKACINFRSGASLTFLAGCSGPVLQCSNVNQADYSCAGDLPYASRINDFAVTAGQVVWIRISDPYFHGTSNLDIRFPDHSPPDNDTCYLAPENDYYFYGSSYATLPFDTRYAQTDGPEVSCSASGAPTTNDVFFGYFAVQNFDRVTFDTCGADFDSVLSVYTGTCGALTEVACNDDSCGQQSSITFTNVTVGTHYIIRIAGWNGARGNGTLNIVQALSCTVVPPGAVSEGEACGDNNNGGCGDLSNQFFDLPAGPITIAGTSWSSASQQDSDWYRLITTAGATRIKFSVDSDLPAIATLYALPTGDCAGGIIGFASTQDYGCPDPNYVEAALLTVAPGTYAIVVTPFFPASYACGTQNTYVLTIDSATVGACDLGSCCLSTTADDCAVRGGIYAGDGSVCRYGYNAPEVNYEDISATGSPGPDGDNESMSAAFGEYFNFALYGGYPTYAYNTYSFFSINTNGVLYLEQPGNPLQLDQNRSIPSIDAPLYAIFGLWTDLATAGAPNGSGHIYYQTLGEAPYRRFIVQWENVARVSQPGTVNFQIVLFETTGLIELRYRDIPADRFGGTDHADYIVGVQDYYASSATSIDTSTLGTGNTTRRLGISLCPTSAYVACRADYNNSGYLDSDDLSDFITEYFNEPPAVRADFNYDGVINSDDISDYIVAYFNGCY